MNSFQSFDFFPEYFLVKVIFLDLGITKSKFSLIVSFQGVLFTLRESIFTGFVLFGHDFLKVKWKGCHNIVLFYVLVFLSCDLRRSLPLRRFFIIFVLSTVTSNRFNDFYVWNTSHILTLQMSFWRQKRNISVNRNFTYFWWNVEASNNTSLSLQLHNVFDVLLVSFLL